MLSLADLAAISRSRSSVINKVMTEHDAAIGECLRDSVTRRQHRLEVEGPGILGLV